MSKDDQLSGIYEREGGKQAVRWANKKIKTDTVRQLNKHEIMHMGIRTSRYRQIFKYIRR